MRIDGTTAMLQAMLAAPAPRRPEPAPFAPAQAQAPLPGQLAANAPVPSVAMLVTLAAAGSEPERRQEMARDAATGLDRLDALHRELLVGRLTPARLQALKDWSRARTRPADPELARIMDELDLRILVELAKHDRG